MDDIVPPKQLLERFSRFEDEGNAICDIFLARGWSGAVHPLGAALEDIRTAYTGAEEHARADLEMVDPACRAGGWIITVTGGRFWPLDPRPEDVRPEDIAHGLATKGRFNCQCRRRPAHDAGRKGYSVGAHTLRVRALAEELARREGLDVRLAGGYAIFHDGNEAYLPDIPRPVKPFVPGWDLIEQAVQDAIHVRFGLGPIPVEVADVVKLADDYALGIEARAVYHPEHAADAGVYPTDQRLLELGRVIGANEGSEPWLTEEEVYDKLMQAFRALSPRWELGEDTTEEPEAEGGTWKEEPSNVQDAVAKAMDRTAKWRQLLDE